VTAAVLAVGDVLVRAPQFGSGAGIGLRGGHFNITETAGGYRLTLRRLRWTEDLQVSGTVTASARSGPVHADLRLVGAKDISGTLRVDWVEGTALARASVHGQLGGQAVAAELDAP